ncbi:hypothetical protein AB0J80_36175 [Actinoplanes sp. NPDC049548]|uniref:hypothetical protein n=1 Tax=Actinoplanes sp. NPDC049548 TaxID=3155152 RepID=UPI003418C77A
MSSPAANRRKGAQWEIDLMKGLREHGHDVERLRLAGKDDEGDLVVKVIECMDRNVQHVVVEAKAGVLHPAEFVREAMAERLNYAKARGLDLIDVRGVVLAKARGKNWKDAYVITTVRDYFGLED